MGLKIRFFMLGYYTPVLLKITFYGLNIWDVILGYLIWDVILDYLIWDIGINCSINYWGWDWCTV